MLTTLASTLQQVPHEPGVYRYFDAKNRLLYVGKAKDLHKRVHSYFRPNAMLAEDKKVMVASIARIEWTIVRSETEALLLETTLIKKHHPPYNIVMRDDKSYAFLKITKDEFPRLISTRKYVRDGSRYFGPYTSVAAINRTLHTIRDIFSGKRRNVRDFRIPDDMTCLFHEPGACDGLCRGLVLKSQHQELVGMIIDFLQGKYQSIITQTEDSMRRAAQEQRFEMAAKLRNQLESLKRMNEQQYMVGSPTISADYIGLATAHTKACVTMLVVREGKMIDTRHFLIDTPKAQDATKPKDVVQAFVEQYYPTAVDVPHTVYTQLPLHLDDTVCAELSTQLPRGQRFSLELSQRGKNRQLVELASKNASDYLKQQFASWQKSSIDTIAGVQELQSALSIPNIHRIECYDISNVQGTNPVASMIVFHDGVAKKSEYKKFTIRGKQTPDDFAMLKEALTRRATHTEWEVPDLIIIDGGKGQLSSVMDAIATNETDTLIVPKHQIVSLAKQEEILFRQLPDGGYEEIRLRPGSQGYFLIQRVRDEAHRFAITFHRARRSVHMVSSGLDAIAGIGPRTKKLLLTTYGDIQGIREADEKELEKLVGKHKAKLIRDTL